MACHKTLIPLWCCHNLFWWMLTMLRNKGSENTAQVTAKHFCVVHSHAIFRRKIANMATASDCGSCKASFTTLVLGLLCLHTKYQWNMKQFCQASWCLIVNTMLYSKPPWRNRLARSAVNRKVGGSSPPGGDAFYRYIIFLFSYITNKYQ